MSGGREEGGGRGKYTGRIIKTQKHNNGTLGRALIRTRGTLSAIPDEQLCAELNHVLAPKHNRALYISRELIYKSLLVAAGEKCVCVCV